MNAAAGKPAAPSPDAVKAMLDAVLGVADPAARAAVLSQDEVLRQMAVTLAKQEAMQGAQKILPHGARLYRVPAGGWQAQVIAADPETVVCETPLDMDNAAADNSVPVVFLPVHATVDDAMLEKILHRHGVVMTVFREVREA